MISFISVRVLEVANVFIRVVLNITSHIWMAFNHCIKIQGSVSMKLWLSMKLFWV